MCTPWIPTSLQTSHGRCLGQHPAGDRSPALPGGSTFDLLGETHSLRVRQGLRLLVDVPDVQHLAHELDYGLGFVEGGGRHCRTGTTMSLCSLPADRPSPRAGQIQPPQTHPAPLLQFPAADPHPTATHRVARPRAQSPPPRRGAGTSLRASRTTLCWACGRAKWVCQHQKIHHHQC